MFDTGTNEFIVGFETGFGIGNGYHKSELHGDCHPIKTKNWNRNLLEPKLNVFFWFWLFLVKECIFFLRSSEEDVSSFIYSPLFFHKWRFLPQFTQFFVVCWVFINFTPLLPKKSFFILFFCLILIHFSINKWSTSRLTFTLYGIEFLLGKLECYMFPLFSVRKHFHKGPTIHAILKVQIQFERSISIYPSNCRGILVYIMYISTLSVLS